MADFPLGLLPGNASERGSGVCGRALLNPRALAVAKPLLVQSDSRVNLVPQPEKQQGTEKVPCEGHVPEGGFAYPCEGGRTSHLRVVRIGRILDTSKGN